jgi:hypothetical protein
VTDYRPADLVRMMIEAARDLEQAQDELIAATHKHSEADRRYRQARATAYLASSGTVGERESYVAKSCDEETYAAHLAEGLAKAAMEQVRNRRQVLSSLQSIAAAVKAEAEFARFEGRETRSA